MITETKEVYKCEHRRKLYQIKTACENHELKCKKNPINHRKCFDCVHLKKEVLLYYFDTGFGERERNVDVFVCDKINSALYPPHTNDRFEFGEPQNQEMKKECEFFKSQFNSKNSLFNI